MIHTPRYFLPLLATMWCAAIPAWSNPDQLWLHNGQTLEGNLLQEQNGTYLFQPVQGVMARVPKNTVRLVVLGTEAKAAQYLRLDDARKLAQTQTLSKLQILPTPAIGNSLLEGVRQATNSIHILAYNLSPCSIPPVSAFFETLREKARAGVNVVLITEFGSGTSDRLKQQVFEFDMTLQAAGIEIRFIQERRVMHKKFVMVDGRMLWLGSSNLTLAGFNLSDEINACCTAARVLAEAAADFERIRALSKTSDGLSYKGGS